MSLTGCPQPPWTILKNGLFPFGTNGLIVYLDPSDTRADYLTNGTGQANGAWALKADLPDIPPAACLGDFFAAHVPNGCVLPQCSNASGAIGWPTPVWNSLGQKVAYVDVVTVMFQVGAFSSVAAAISMFTNVQGLYCSNATLLPGEALNNETQWVPERFSCFAWYSNIWNLSNPPAYQTNEEFDPAPPGPGVIEANLELEIPNPYALEWTGTWTFSYPNGCVMTYAVDMKPYGQVVNVP